MSDILLRDVWDKLNDVEPSPSTLSEKRLDVRLSDKSLELVPGQQPAQLGVRVINRSDRLTSFQIELLAAGSDTAASSHWYSLSPKVSAVTPPGDTSEFQVTLLDTPLPGFLGWVSLTVRVYALELKAEERQVLRLKISPPEGTIPLKLELLKPIVRTRPGQAATLPVRIYNLTQLTVGCLVRCDGLPRSWFNDSEQGPGQALEQGVDLLPQQWTTVEFSPILPALSEALARSLPLTVQAEVPGSPPVTAAGRLEILPVGRLAFRPPSPARQFLPRHWPWQSAERRRAAEYQLIFENASNLEPQLSVDLDSDNPDLLQWRLASPEAPWHPGTEQINTLHLRAPRPWFGRTQTHWIDVRARLSDERLGKPVPESRPLRLDVAPVVPLWLAILVGVGGLWLLWLLSWFNPANPWFGHRAAVNSVRFDGLGQTVVSGSNDQTAIFWRGHSFFNPFANQLMGRVAAADKAVRVASYRPEDNNLLAVGLENGEIQLWDLLSGDRTLAFSPDEQRDDRVLDLLFSPDSQTLFSSHGSGTVMRWSLASPSVDPSSQRLLQSEPFPFAAYSLAAVGGDRQMVAVAGRYNRLALWDWQGDRQQSVTLTPGGQDDYVTSLATAEAEPNWLAIADNQGYITLLDLESCLSTPGDCQVIDRWAANASGEPVREVALTRDGCFLASVGDDGQAMIWPLFRGRRNGRFATGQVVARTASKLNSVDVMVRRNRLWLVYGADDSRVRVYRTRLPNAECR